MNFPYPQLSTLNCLSQTIAFEVADKTKPVCNVPHFLHMVRAETVPFHDKDCETWSSDLEKLISGFLSWLRVSDYPPKKHPEKLFHKCPKMKNV